MYSHIFVGSNDLDKSKQFYDAVFAALDGKPGFLDAKGRLIYMHNGAMFMVTKPLNGQAATPANGGTNASTLRARYSAGVCGGPCATSISQTPACCSREEGPATTNPSAS